MKISISTEPGSARRWQNLTDKFQKSQRKNESAVPQPAADEIITARKYDVLEKSCDYEDMKISEKLEEEVSEIERIRGLFSVSGAMSKMFSDLLETVRLRSCCASLDTTAGEISL